MDDLSSISQLSSLIRDSGDQPFSVAMVDLNGDGKPDMVTAQGSNEHIGEG